MIHLNYKNTRGRVSTNKLFTNVTTDVLLFLKVINRTYSADMDIMCPSSAKKEDSGIINTSELWFGEPNVKNACIDIRAMESKSLKLETKNPLLKLWFQMTCLSISEQFVYTKFTTNEDFTLAVEMYEALVGSLSDNACRSLGIERRV